MRMSTLRTRMIHLLFQGFLCLFVTLTPSVIHSSVTGTLHGTVRDHENNPLPGVWITAESPLLPETRSTRTDYNGIYQFLSLPAGIYTVHMELSGFQDQTEVDVVIKQGEITSRESVLKCDPEFLEEIVIDDRLAYNELYLRAETEFFLGDTLDQLPVGRDYTSVLKLIPGSQYEDTVTNSYAIHGSTGIENEYSSGETAIYNLQGIHLPIEYTQEIMVIPLAPDVNYGRATGGVVHLVTKFGGAHYRGDLFGYYQGDQIQSDFVGREFNDPTSPTMQRTGITLQDYGFTLGGPVLKDRLYFFTGFDLVMNRDTVRVNDAVRDTYDTPSSHILETGRKMQYLNLTYHLHNNHTLIGKFIADPGEAKGPMVEIRGEKGTYWATHEFGGEMSKLDYTAILSENLLFSVSGSYHDNRDRIDPLSDEILFIDKTHEEEYRTGGFGHYVADESSRNQVEASLTYYLDEALGDHTIKSGWEIRETDVTRTQKYTGGQQVWILPCDPARDYPDCDLALYDAGRDLYYYYAHEFYVTPDSTQDRRLFQNNHSESPRGDSQVFFIQDDWSILRNFMLSLGIRLDRQRIYDYTGDRFMDLDNNWAPRVGLAWDLQNDGHHILHLHAGRYFQSVPMNLPLKFTDYITASIKAYHYNSDPVDLTPDHNLRWGPIYHTGCWLWPCQWDFLGPIDPGLKGQSMDEYVAGYETDLLTGWSFGITGIYRNLNRVIETGRGVTGDGYGYIVGNAGEGFLSYAPDQGGTIEGPGPLGSYPVPPPKREYSAVQLTARKHNINNWAFHASYVWSKLEGNYDGPYQRFNGQLNPNTNTAFDYADFMYVVDPEDPLTTPVDGLLSNDREHQFKVYGSWRCDFGMEVGGFAYWRSGRPLSALGWSDTYESGEFWLTRRGALGRMPSEYEMDLRIGYPFKYKNLSIRTFLDILNLFNRQQIIDMDMLWNLSEGDVVDGSLPGCEDYGGMGYDPSIPSACAPNPNYMKGVAWQDPRTFRIGFKISF